MKKQSLGFWTGIVNSDDEDSEMYPSEKTMLRWHHWYILNQFNMEGHMKSIGYRLLGFKEELLRSSSSLLEQIKSSMPDTWLRTILRYLYNSGNSLQPFYSLNFTDFVFTVREKNCMMVSERRCIQL